jgi:hypothetical protein
VLFQNLQPFAMTGDYLSEHLVSVACDSAAVMLGNRSGVKKLIKGRFPFVIVWHCVNHSLELSVSDATHAVLGINQFISFIDKLYVLYHASPKNTRELCAKLMELYLVSQMNYKH